MHWSENGRGGDVGASAFDVQGFQAKERSRVSAPTSSWRSSISGGEAKVRVGLASKDCRAPWPAFGLALAPPSVRSARARACSYGRSHAPAQVSRPVTYHTACNSLNHALLWHDKLRCEGRTPFPALSPNVCRRPLCCGRCSPGFRVPSRVRRRVGHATRGPHTPDIPRDPVAGPRDMPRVRRVR